MIERIILHQIANENIQIAEIYKNNILAPNFITTTKMQKLGYKNLLSDPDFIKFIKATDFFFQTTVAKIALFDGNGDKFFANSNSEIVNIYSDPEDNIYNKVLNIMDRYYLSKLIINNGLNEAFQGRTSHKLIPKAVIIDNHQQQNKAVFIRSYIPILDINNMQKGLITTVLQIDNNVTQQWQNISYLERNILIAFLLIFSFFFAIIIYNTSYAQKIIDQQIQKNNILTTARVNAEDANFAKTEFLASVSHELRTPLSSIIGFSEIITSEIYGPINNGKYKEYANDILTSGKHLLSVINDILDFSKAAADKLKIQNIETDINKLSRITLRFIQLRAEQSGINIIDQIPESPIVVNIDPQRFKQSLLNILSNSVKFTPKNGSITLTISKLIEKNQVQVKISDTGIGIKQQDIPKALSTFNQIDNTLSRNYDGTGLGLPLSKKLIELMGGTFEIISDVGSGTKVVLTFNCKTT